MSYISESPGIGFKSNFRTMQEGPYSNNPSGSNATLWWQSSSTGGGLYTFVYFDEKVSSVSFFYSSIPSVTLEAFDQNGNILSSSNLPGNYDGGLLSVWDPIEVSICENAIKYVKIYSLAFQTYLDDLKISQIAYPVPIDIKSGSDPNSINLGAQGSVPVAIFSTQDFDATTIDPATVTLAGAAVKLKGKSDSPQASLKDINGDGLTDLLVHIVIDGLELELGSNEAELEGWTYDNEKVYGTDSVNIVPP